jgi:hypothetical protein
MDFHGQFVESHEVEPLAPSGLKPTWELASLANPVAQRKPLRAQSVSIFNFNVRLTFRVGKDFCYDARPTVHEIQAQSSVRHPIDFDNLSVRSAKFVLLQSFAHPSDYSVGLASGQFASRDAKDLFSKFFDTRNKFGYGQPGYVPHSRKLVGTR